MLAPFSVEGASSKPGAVQYAGADPNALREMGRPHSLYDWACIDYELDVWDVNKMPEAPTDEDRASEESWIAYLDRLATTYGKRRPDYLAVLREYGALTAAEMRTAGTQ